MAVGVGILSYMVTTNGVILGLFGHHSVTFETLWMSIVSQVGPTCGGGRFWSHFEDRLGACWDPFGSLWDTEWSVLGSHLATGFATLF